MEIEYMLAVIENDGRYSRRLAAAGYAVFPFKNNKSLSDFPFYEYFDLIVNEKSLKISRPESSVITDITEPLSATVGDILTEAINRHRDFSEDVALSYLDNNYNIYRKVLRRYYIEYGNLDKTIMPLFINKDYRSISEYLHKIKGISLNIGALRLYDFIEKLEMHLKKNIVKEEEVRLFLKYHARIIKYCKELGE